jgi:spore coat polysaccharide biosynthesis protein SpsF
MKRVIIIQARMTSTRLPGKVLMDLGGRPLLARQLERLRRCRQVDELCIATTANASDDPIAALARRESVACFRGDEEDVLSRYTGAAALTGAELVVRVTSDCPLIDPGITDQVIARALEPDAACDYVSNVEPRRFPRGLDTEAFFIETLRRVARMATSRPAREHVTWFILREHPELFVRRQVVGAVDHSDLRWTVDTEADLAMVRALWEAAGLAERDLPFAELVALARQHPQITTLNAHVEQKSL